MALANNELSFLLDPKSVAIIGASDSPDKIGGRSLYYMRKYNYQGTIYAVNPGREVVQGEKSWSSLLDLPETPDLVIIAVAGKQAIEAVEMCAEKGVKGAIIISAGFSETGAEGKANQDRMLEVAQAAGMRLIGPNSQGLANFGTGAIASFSTMFLEIPPQDGPVAVISQSGGMSAMVYGLLRKRQIGVRHMHATGNEADITVADLAKAVLVDPDIKVVCLYLESIQNAQTFAEAMKVAKQKGIPVIAVKTGSSMAGMKAAASHTGALANEDRLVDAFFEAHDIIRAKNPEEMALLAEYIVKTDIPIGRDLVVVSNSGASCVLTCDAAEESGLNVTSLSETTQNALKKILSSFATTNNPVDITAALLSNNGLFGEVLNALESDKNADIFIINIPVAGRGYDVERFATDASEFTKKSKKPVIIITWLESVANKFRDFGLMVFETEHQAMRILSLLTNYKKIEKSLVFSKNNEDEVKEKGKFLSEETSLDYLYKKQIPIVDFYTVLNEKEAISILDDMKSKVVLKACSEDIPHKSEYDLVKLNIENKETLIASFNYQSAILEKLGIKEKSWIVAKQEKGLHEAMVGAYVDDIFGPVVVVGSGGKYVEALPDVALIMPPFSKDQIIKKIKNLRLGVLLSGVRGEAESDIETLADIAVKVGDIILNDEKLKSIDINPILVKEKGVGAIAVDALVEMK